MPVAGWNQVELALNGPWLPLVTKALWLEIETALYERVATRTCLDATWGLNFPPIVPGKWPAVAERDPINAFQLFRDYAYGQQVAQPWAYCEDVTPPDPYYMANVGDPTPPGYVSLFVNAGLVQDFWTIADPTGGLDWTPLWADFELILNKLVFYHLPGDLNFSADSVTGGSSKDYTFDVLDTYPAYYTGVNLSGCNPTARFVYYFQYTFGGTGSPALSVSIVNSYDPATGESYPPGTEWLAVDSVDLMADGLPHWVKMVWFGDLVGACPAGAGAPPLRAAVRFHFAGSPAESVTIENAQAYLDFDWQYHG